MQNEVDEWVSDHDNRVYLVGALDVVKYLLDKLNSTPSDNEINRDNVKKLLKRMHNSLSKKRVEIFSKLVEE